jgi:hypothetical protein
MSIRTYFSAFAIVALLLPRGMSQDVAPAPPAAIWMINVPASPLIMQLNPRGDKVLVSNLTTLGIRGYREGCVKKLDGVFESNQAFEWKSENFGPRSEDGRLDSWSAPVDGYAKKREVCTKVAGKIAVIEVEYQDGSHWIVRRGK